MSVTTTVHVNFRGQAREALTFYQSVFGGQLMLATYADIDAAEAPDQVNRIAFGRVLAPNGFDLMAYDVQPSKGYDAGQNPFYVALRGADVDEIQTGWDALADQARAILIPIGPSAFGPLYGMLTDRYGITWIVGADAPEQS